MKRILFSLLLFCCSSMLFAEVYLQLESKKVQLGQNFSLTLTLDGAQAGLTPDLTALQQDFTIIGTERSMNYTVINGQARSTGQWTIIMQPKRSGVLSIPAIQVGQQKTAATTIEVSYQPPATNPLVAGQQDVMLRTAVDIKNPYVNQQVIYTVKLYNSRRLVDTDYQPPEAGDALLIPCGDERRYQISENGRVYAVEEQQFALFAQKSGELTIKPPSFKAMIYDTVAKPVAVQAKPIVLKVKPAPVDFKGKNWLPAKQVRLSETYDKSITSLAQGSTLIRTLTLEAVALPAQLLPALNVNSSNQFSLYPEKPNVKTAFNQQDLVGTTTLKLTYLLNQPGKITIPALTLPWFNTVTGKEEVSVLPKLTLSVSATTALQSKSAASITAKIATQAFSKLQEKKKETSIKPLPTENKLAWWLAGGFALAWLITLAAWYWYRSHSSSPQPTKKQMLNQLREACLKNNLVQARDCLLNWARLHWPDASLLNIIDLQKLAVDPGLKEQINQLSTALYHKTSLQGSWQGLLLWQAILAFNSRKPVKNSHVNPLPPIHRL